MECVDHVIFGTLNLKDDTGDFISAIKLKTVSR